MSRGLLGQRTPAPRGGSCARSRRGRAPSHRSPRSVSRATIGRLAARSFGALPEEGFPTRSECRERSTAIVGELAAAGLDPGSKLRGEVVEVAHDACVEGGSAFVGGHLVELVCGDDPWCGGHEETLPGAATVIARPSGAVPPALPLVVSALPCSSTSCNPRNRPRSERRMDARSPSSSVGSLVTAARRSFCRVRLLGHVGATGHVISMAPSPLRWAAILRA